MRYERKSVFKNRKLAFLDVCWTYYVGIEYNW